jgi:hypothetical protein
MTELAIFREYEPHECGRDGYPFVWHHGLVGWGGDDEHCAEPWLPEYGTRIEFRLDAPDVTAVAETGVRDVVRMRAGHRCIRCEHPYRDGVFTWDDAPARDVTAGADRNVAFDGIEGVEAQPGLPGRQTHWSPCDRGCLHGAPVRVADSHRPGPDGDWRYSLPQKPRDALTVNPTFNAGALVRDGLVVEAAWRILTVHHLNGRKHDLRWWNLASLCQRCHLLIQKTVIMERVWPWEHDEWFKPYAAGWYAYAYLGLNLTREETMERLDELLALERMA